jgi:hypothetical protein
MKTHALAKTLRTLADIFEQSPNIELSKFGDTPSEKSELDTKQVAINLRTLHSLSKINKQDWLRLINEYGFSINIEPRDSSRNIIGRVLSYLDANPQAIDTLKQKSKESPGSPSALNRALDILLQDL